MYILGIHYGHNSSAVLFKNNLLLNAISEERFSKKKNDMEFPINAIRFCLKENNLIKPDIICIANKQFYYEDYLTKSFSISKEKDIHLQEKYYYPLLYKNKKKKLFKILEPQRNQYPTYYWKKSPKERSIKDFTNDIRDIVSRELDVSKSKIFNIMHHKCHANYGYYSSPFNKKKTLIFTIDGSGDYGLNATISIGKNGILKEFYRTKNFFLGRIYSYMTLLMGMKRLEHEYKIMGLAPYGENRFDKNVYNVFDKCLELNGFKVKFKNKPKDAFFHFEKKLRGVRFDVISHCLQKWVEDILIKWIKNTIKIKKINNIVLSGGVALNAKAIGKILKLKQVKSLWVPGVSSDESNCIGAVVEKLGNNKFFDLKSLYFGFDADLEESSFIKEIKKKKKFRVINYNSKKVAQYILNGKIFGRCVGKMEFGPRSLGNRAIIANPKIFEIKKKINEVIKRRDFWMPFAPTILDKYSKKYLKNIKKFKSPFMSTTYDTTELGYQNLKAASHDFDGSVRAQILFKKNNSSYYELIEKFAKISNCGALLNTSYNLHGAPIIKNLNDALFVLDNSGLDGLITKNFLILKKTKN